MTDTGYTPFSGSADRQKYIFTKKPDHGEEIVLGIRECFPEQLAEAALWLMLNNDTLIGMKILTAEGQVNAYEVRQGSHRMFYGDPDSACIATIQLIVEAETRNDAIALAYKNGLGRAIHDCECIGIGSDEPEPVTGDAVIRAYNDRIEEERQNLEATALRLNPWANIGEGAFAVASYEGHDATNHVFTVQWGDREHDDDDQVEVSVYMNRWSLLVGESPVRTNKKKWIPTSTRIALERGVEPGRVEQNIYLDRSEYKCRFCRATLMSINDEGVRRAWGKTYVKDDDLEYDSDIDWDMPPEGYNVCPYCNNLLGAVDEDLADAIVRHNNGLEDNYGLAEE